MGNSVDEQLIAKYFQGRCTPEETVLVEEWLWKDYQETKGKMPEEAVLSLREKLREQIRPDDKAAVAEIKTGNKTPVVAIRRKRHYMIAAAAVLVVLVAGVLLREGRPAATATGSEVVYRDSIYNKGDQPYEAVLADGSTVWLNTGSVLYIGADFNKTERRVKISGEALFDIKQDPGRPFYTEAGKLTTQVLGTRYDIEAWPMEKEICVSLLQGKVAVHSADSSCTLSPGQSVSYSRQTGGMEVGALSVTDPAAWIDGKIVFNRIALPEALDRLSRLYHTSLQYDPSLIREKHITGEFDRDTLPEVLKSILFVHHLKFGGAANGGYRIY